MGVLVLFATTAGAVTNVVGNRGFETGTSGWNTSGGATGITLAQDTGGHFGGYAARLTNTNSSNGDCLLNDSPNWVAKGKTLAGAYMGSLWVRADTAGATLKLRLREYSTSGARLGVSTSTIGLTTNWQHVTVTLPVSSPGDSTLDFNAYVSNAAPGTCFYADDAAIANVPPDASPTAALTVGPDSAGGSLGVTADALQSTAGDAIASYTFDFGDGSAPVGPQASPAANHTYTTAGNYAVTVTVTDMAGIKSTATQQVTVPYTAPSPYPTAVMTVIPRSTSWPSDLFTIDASGSTPGASPIYSYSYDYYGSHFGESSPGIAGLNTVNAAFGSSINAPYTVPGTYIGTMTVTDAAGRQTSTHQVVNAAEGFETEYITRWNTNGGASGITISLVAGGHSGNYAAKLTNTNATNATCLLNDSPNVITKTLPGQYTGTVWVRADTAGATVNLRLREYSTTGALLGTKVAHATLSTTWQQVSATLPTTAPGSTIDYNVYVPNAAPGTCFYADDGAISNG